ncbi:MAG: oligosaccharide flippase family protein, partial [Patescibacteria group bacterium]|nr:oligosaccharide flippase family protein [Patescibacteria group bacterium]
MKKISLEKYFVGLSKDSLIYGVGNAILKVLALITAPIFTRIFVPQQYGVISLIASVISFISLLLIFGMDNAIFVSYYQYKKERQQVISSALWFLLSWGLVIIGTLSFLAGSISNFVFKSNSFQFLFLLSLWTAFMMLLVNLAKVVFRLEFRAKTFALVTGFNAILATGLMILFVAYLKKGLVGYFEGQLIGTFFSMILALYLIRHNLKFLISYARLKEMVLFGAMVVPASLSFFVFDLSDRFFINHYRGLTELGLYSIGINIASLLVFFSYALGQAWSPQVMNIYFESKKVFHQFIPRFFVYYLIFFFSLATLLSLFGLEILQVLTTPKFYDAAKVIGPLSLAMVFAASNQVTALGITLSRKTKFLAVYTAMAAVLNIILNFLLIPRYGMVGAGWATALSYLFLTVAYFLCSQKFIHLEIEWAKVLKLVILSLVVM